MLLSSLVKRLDRITPPALAESWDNVGFQVGNPNWEVFRALVVLDVTSETIGEALKKKVELILAHHPVLFRPAKSLIRYGEGDLVFQLLEKKLALYVAHTNLDSLRGGVADALAEELGLEHTAPLEAKEIPRFYFQYRLSSWSKRWENVLGEAESSGLLAWWRRRDEPEGLIVEGVGERELFLRLRRFRGEELLCIPVPCKRPFGLGRVGSLPKSLWAKDFLSLLKRTLQAPKVRFIGNLRRKIRRVALLPGSGGSFIPQVAKMGVDAYVTGDVKHHEALEAKERQLFVVDGGHYLTERLVLPYWARMVQEACPELEVVVSQVWTDPFQYF